MHSTSLTFFGTFRVVIANTSISAFRTDKVRALLIYLALEAGRPHRRERLAALFWPECAHESALYNLRLTLHRLRQALDAVAPGISDTLFTITRSAIEFNTATVQMDVQHFQQLVGECETHPHADLAQCALCLDCLQQAVALYRGELLAGFSLADAPEFEEWLLMRRETLHHLTLIALHTLADAYERQNEEERALPFAQRKLALDPYREESHQQLMRLLARCGLVSQALAQYERCHRLLREEVGAELDAETIALAAQIRAGKFGRERRPKLTRVREAEEKGHLEELQMASLGAPLPTSSLALPASSTDPATDPATMSPPHNLPFQLTPFVGREQELTELKALLQQPEVHLLTLVGPGGMGKTRLALEIGRILLPSFRDGVFWVSLASIAEPTAIAPAIAVTLGLTLQGDLQQALGQALRLKQLLLILDNCEHLLPSAVTATGATTLNPESLSIRQLVIALLRVAPSVRILATSRERLNLRVEQLYPIEGMALAQEATLTTAARVESVCLFVKSVQRIHPRFSLREANLSAVLHICRFVQGMPLGLELAAARADQFTIAEIAREIEHCMDFLTLEQDDVVVRQRSIRAVFAWSWRLLNEHEQAVLGCLSVFRGSFTYAAAEAITGASLSVLTSLIHKSLLRVVQRPATVGQAESVVRYELHELLRQFAAEQLALIPEQEKVVVTRHSLFYLQIVAQFEQHLAYNDFQTAVAELQGEIDNIRQAWATAIRQRQIEALDASAFALWFFYEFVGLTAEGAQVFHSAVECIRTAKGMNEAVPVSEPFSRRTLSKLLAIQASFFVNLSKNEQALVCTQEALQFSVSAPGNEPGIEGETLGYLVLGQALRRKGQTLDARRYLEHALDLVCRYPNSGRLRDWLAEIECRAYGWLCSIALTPFHDYTAAKTYAKQKVQRAQSLGKRHAEMAGLSDLADIALAVGDYTVAQQYYEQVLEQARKFGNRIMEAVCLDHLGRILQSQGHYAPSYQLFEAALAIFGATGNPIGQINVLNALIQLSTLLGAYSQAQAWCEQFLNISQTVEPPLTEFLDNLLSRVLLAYYSSDSLQALRYAEQCWQVAQQVADPLHMAKALTLMGHIQTAQQPDAAIASYHQALAYYVTAHAKQQAIEAQAGLVQIALAQGDRVGALAQAEAIFPILAEHPYTGDNNFSFVYLTCYQALAEDPVDPRAVSILQKGYDLLQQFAATLDGSSRRRFLEEVPPNRALIAAYQAWRAQADRAMGSAVNSLPSSTD